MFPNSGFVIRRTSDKVNITASYLHVDSHCNYSFVSCIEDASVYRTRARAYGRMIIYIKSMLNATSYHFEVVLISKAIIEQTMND